MASASNFSYTGTLSGAGWGPAQAESSPVNGVYYWDINRSGSTINPSSGAGYFFYDPAVGHMDSIEGYTGETATHWYFGPGGGPRWSVLKTAPFNGTAPTSGPTVTSGRIARSGTIPLANNFTVRYPTVTKTAAQQIKVQWYDQNEPSTGYNMTVTWQTASGEHSSTQAITQGSGDIYLQFNLAAQAFQIKNGLIKLQISVPVYYNGLLYGANAIFKTFTYYETGPYTASFSPNFGLPGQSVSVFIQDTNPYPDADTPTSFNMIPDTTNTIGAPLNSANNYTQNLVNILSGSNAVQHGIYKIFNGSTVLATATYDTNYVAPSTTSNGGGKPDRYPLIMTNLFNRNRSLYSIGMTHKDTWDLFL